MSDSGSYSKKAPTTSLVQGEKDRVLERHVARVNDHDLSKCEGWEGPLTPEEQRLGIDEWYTFWVCEKCGVEAAIPPHRWETIECEPGVDGR